MGLSIRSVTVGRGRGSPSAARIFGSSESSLRSATLELHARERLLVDPLGRFEMRASRFPTPGAILKGEQLGCHTVCLSK